MLAVFSFWTSWRSPETKNNFEKQNFWLESLDTVRLFTNQTIFHKIILGFKQSNEINFTRTDL